MSHIQIEDGQQRRLVTTREPPHLTAPPDGADRDQNQANYEDCRQNQIGQYAQVRTPLESDLLHREQARHEHQGRNCERSADETDRVVCNGRKKILKHSVPLLPVSPRGDFGSMSGCWPYSSAYYSIRADLDIRVFRRCCPGRTTVRTCGLSSTLAVPLRGRVIVADLTALFRP